MKRQSVYITSLLFIFIYTNVFCAILLKGKVYDEKKNTVRNLSLRLSTIGNVTTTNSGEFIIELPEDIRYVEVELTGTDYRLIYPFDQKIPVPLDQNYITKIVVAKSIEQVKDADEAAKKYTRLETLLKEIGIAQTDLKGLISEYVEKESRESKLNGDAIKEAIFIEKRGECYSEISRVISKYNLESRSLKDGFRLVSSLAFKNENALKELVSFIENYNLVFNELSNNKFAYKSDIALYWNDTTLSENLFNLFNYAVNEIHQPYILKLNEDIVSINRIRLTSLEEEEKKELENKTIENITMIVSELETKLPVLENRSQEFLTELNPAN